MEPRDAQDLVKSSYTEIKTQLPMRRQYTHTHTKWCFYLRGGKYLPVELHPQPQVLEFFHLEIPVFTEDACL